MLRRRMKRDLGSHRTRLQGTAQAIVPTGLPWVSQEHLLLEKS
jgi:hypothetical protein